MEPGALVPSLTPTCVTLNESCTLSDLGPSSADCQDENRRVPKPFPAPGSSMSHLRTSRVWAPGFCWGRHFSDNSRPWDLDSRPKGPLRDTVPMGFRAGCAPELSAFIICQLCPFKSRTWPPISPPAAGTRHLAEDTGELRSRRDPG